MNALLAEFDKSVADTDEGGHFRDKLTVSTRHVVKLFSIAYGGTNLAVISATLLSLARRVKFTACLPFGKYFANDIYLTMSLFIKAEHVHLLARQVAQVARRSIVFNITRK